MLLSYVPSRFVTRKPHTYSEEGIVLVEPSRKINVFISSVCGKENYDYVRDHLKKIIEETGLATVYLFEHESASTLSAGQHYRYNLRDSDICIFLIDNADGVSTAVQSEINDAKKHGIKSLFYFCDQRGCEQTPLQKSLMGASYAKSKTVHSFEEFIAEGSQGLIDDIAMIYRCYCKGRLDDYSDDASGIKGFLLGNNNFRTSLVTPKAIVDNINSCKAYFFRMATESDEKTEASNALDNWGSKFLPILFEWKSIDEFNASIFLNELEAFHSIEYHKVVCKRWDAIQAYFQGNLDKTIVYLETALENAREISLPDWIIKDILIDIRNQRSSLNQSRNVLFLTDPAQEEIAQSDQALIYPFIDRIDTLLNEQYVADGLKEKIKSPHTITFGNNIQNYTDLLASAYIIAMFNGSLTHIIQLYDQMKHLAFSLCQRFSDWEHRLLLLKMAIYNGAESEIDGIIASFPEILNRMSDKDAVSIYEFCVNRPIIFQRLRCQLQAFKVVGYFLNNENFSRISVDILHQISDELKKDEPIISVVSNMFACLQGVSERLDKNSLVEICCQCIGHRLKRVYYEMFKFMAYNIDISEINASVAKKLVDDLILVLEDPDKNIPYSYLMSALCNFRNQSHSLTERLDIMVYDHMPEPLVHTYQMETNHTEDEISRFIEKKIQTIDHENGTRGNNGVYSGIGENPFASIKSIVMGNRGCFDHALLDRIFTLTCDTLLCTNQVGETKCGAIDLLVCICIKYPAELQKQHSMVDTLKAKRNTIYCCGLFLSNLTEAELQFSSLLLFSCFGEAVWLQMIEILPCFQNDIKAQIRACIAVVSFLACDEAMVIDIHMEAVILQHALAWAVSDNLDVRYNAIKILFLLLRNGENIGIVCNQLVKSIDNDNHYIKRLILRRTFANDIIDSATREYILSKCKTDPNYIVRKTSLELETASK